MASRVRRTDCSKEIAQAEAQAALWESKARQLERDGRKDKAAQLMIRSRFYLSRADRMRPQLKAAE